MSAHFQQIVGTKRFMPQTEVAKRLLVKMRSVGLQFSFGKFTIRIAVEIPHQAPARFYADVTNTLFDPEAVYAALDDLVVEAIDKQRELTEVLEEKGIQVEEKIE